MSLGRVVGSKSRKLARLELSDLVRRRDLVGLRGAGIVAVSVGVGVRYHDRLRTCLKGLGSSKALGFRIRAGVVVDPSSFVVDGR